MFRRNRPRLMSSARGIRRRRCLAAITIGADPEQGVSVGLAQRIELSRQDVVEGAGKKCSIYHCNLLEVESLPAVVEQACREHNPAILINCAGIHQAGPTIDFPLADTERIIRLNTTASIVIASEVAKYWLKSDRSAFNRKIINFASISSFQGNLENVAYAASKGAVLNMTRAMSNEWMP
jgi:2-dehydro-3-deoxy-D-gluconate 5-dehydrogenase